MMENFSNPSLSSKEQNGAETAKVESAPSSGSSPVVNMSQKPQDDVEGLVEEEHETDVEELSLVQGDREVSSQLGVGENTTEREHGDGVPQETIEDSKETPTDAKEIPKDAKEIPTDTKKIPTNAKEITDAKEIPTDAMEIPTDAMEIPTDAEEIPQLGMGENTTEREHGDEVPQETVADAKEIPTDAKEIPTDAKEIPTDAKEIPTDAKEIPTDAKEIPTDAEEIPTGIGKIPQQLDVEEMSGAGKHGEVSQNLEADLQDASREGGNSNMLQEAASEKNKSVTKDELSLVEEVKVPEKSINVAKSNPGLECSLLNRERNNEKGENIVISKEEQKDETGAPVTSEKKLDAETEADKHNSVEAMGTSKELLNTAVKELMGTVDKADDEGPKTVDGDCTSRKGVESRKDEIHITTSFDQPRQEQGSQDQDSQQKQSFRTAEHMENELINSFENKKDNERPEEEKEAVEQCERNAHLKGTVTDNQLKCGRDDSSENSEIVCSVEVEQVFETDVNEAGDGMAIGVGVQAKLLKDRDSSKVLSGVLETKHDLTGSNVAAAVKTPKQMCELEVSSTKLEKQSKQLVIQNEQCIDGIDKQAAGASSQVRVDIEDVTMTTDKTGAKGDGKNSDIECLDDNLRQNSSVTESNVEIITLDESDTTDENEVEEVITKNDSCTDQISDAEKANKNFQENIYTVRKFIALRAAFDEYEGIEKLVFDESARRFAVKKKYFLRTCCLFCKMEYPTYQELVDHEKTHSEWRSFLCKWCQKTFSDEKAMYEHKVEILNQYLHSCMTCGKVLFSLEDVEIHVASHLDIGEGMEKCKPSTCQDATEKQSIQLQADSDAGKLTCKEKPVFPCLSKDCAADFSTSKEVETHLITFHKWEKDNSHSRSGVRKDVSKLDNKLVCHFEGCQQHFPDKVALHDHVKVHKMASCIACKKVFTSFQMNIAHEATHIPDCRKITFDKETNMFKPPPITPPMCVICGYVSDSMEKQVLVHHYETVHNVTETYKCHWCVKSFSCKADLEIHVADILNQVLNSCKECGAWFYSLAEADNHIQKHQNLDVQCSQCRLWYNNPADHSLHQKLAHSKDGRQKLLATSAQDSVVFELNDSLHQVAKAKINYQSPKPQSSDKASKSSNSVPVIRIDGLKCMYCALVCTSSKIRKAHEATHAKWLNEISISGNGVCTMQLISWRTCTYCGTWYDSDETLANHRLGHPDWRSYVSKWRCKWCGGRFNGPKAFYTHVISVLKQYINSCTVCGKEYNSFDQVDLHIKTHPLSEVPCKVCKIILTDEDCLANHMQVTHKVSKDKGVLTSSLSTAHLTSEDASKNDINMQHPELPTTTSKQGGSLFLESTQDLTTRSMSSSSEVKVDNVQEVVSQSHTCAMCHTEFVQLSSLLQHISIMHIESNPYQCVMCSESFATDDKLQEHGRARHGAKWEQVHQDLDNITAYAEQSYCVVRNKNEMGELKNSQSVANENITDICDQGGPYVCHVCGYLTVTRQGFNMHLKTMSHQIKCMEWQYQHQGQLPLLDFGGEKTIARVAYDDASLPAHAKAKDKNLKYKRKKLGLDTVLHCKRCFKTFQDKAALLKHVKYWHKSRNPEKASKKNKGKSQMKTSQKKKSKGHVSKTKKAQKGQERHKEVIKSRRERRKEKKSKGAEIHKRKKHSRENPNRSQKVKSKPTELVGIGASKTSDPFVIDICSDGDDLPPESMKTDVKQTSNVEQTYQCHKKGCTDVFKGLLDLALHMTSHDEKSQYLCQFITSAGEKCDKNSSSLLSHFLHIQSIHHNGFTLSTVKKYSETLFKCHYSECIRHFVYQEKLLEHMKGHCSGLGEFICIYCVHKTAKFSDHIVHIMTEHKSQWHDKKNLEVVRQLQNSMLAGRTNAKTWPCHNVHCHKEFSGLFEVALHMITHKKSERYQCQFGMCNVAFQSCLALYKHIDSVHQSGFIEDFTKYYVERTFSCHFRDCTKYYIRQNDLVEHMWTQHSHDGWLMVCPHCSKQSTSLFNHTSHIFREHSNQWYFLERFGFVQQLVKQSSNQLVCGFIGCFQKCDDEDSLRKHVKVHMPWICHHTRCTNGRYYNFNELHKHCQNDHGGDLQMDTTCCRYDHCMKVFKSPSERGDHERTNHDSLSSVPTLLGQIYKCRVCSEYFASNSQVLMHQIKHHDKWMSDLVSCSATGDYMARGRTTLACTYCKEQFVTVEDVSLHEMSHEEWEPSCCKWCSRNFYSRSCLADHVAVLLNNYLCLSNQAKYGDNVSFVFVEKFLEKSKEKQTMAVCCSLCHIWFSNTPCLERHARLPHGNKLLAATRVRNKAGPYLLTVHSQSRVTKNLERHEEQLGKGSSLVLHPNDLCEKTTPEMAVEASAGAHKQVSQQQDFPQNDEVEVVDVESIDSDDVDVLEIDKEGDIPSDDLVYTDTQGMDIMCEVCFEHFDETKHLKKHMKDIHNVLNFKTKPKSKPKNAHQCKFCSKKCRWQSELETHEATHSCKWCKTYFKSKSSLRRHKRKDCKLKPNMTTGKTEEKEKADYKCSVCNKMFENIMEWLSHNHTSSNETPQCSLCQEFFTSNDELKKHKALTHAKGAKHCTECSRWFHTKNQLDKHVKQFHTKPRCKICNCNVRSKTMLKLHMKRHHSGKKTTEKVVVKPPLGKKFLFKCSFCSLRFSEKEYLETHEFMHTVKTTEEIVSKPQRRKPQRRKPEDGKKFLFKCSFCSIRFSEKEYLQTHELMHKEAATFDCEFCLMKFSKAEYLETHREMIHKNTFHECNICKMKFSKMVFLETHMQKRHKIKPSAQGKVPDKLKEQGKVPDKSSQQGKVPSKPSAQEVTSDEEVVIVDVPEKAIEVLDIMSSDDEEKNSTPSISCIYCARHFKNTDDMLKHKVKHTKLKIVLQKLPDVL